MTKLTLTNTENGEVSILRLEEKHAVTIYQFLDVTLSKAKLKFQLDIINEKQKEVIVIAKKKSSL